MLARLAFLLLAIQSASYGFRPLRTHIRGLQAATPTRLHMMLPFDAASLSALMDMDMVTGSATGSSSMWLSEEASTGYSGLSLYFTLALYVLTLPGLYSLVTRSVKTKVGSSYVNVSKLLMSMKD